MLGLDVVVISNKEDHEIFLLNCSMNEIHQLQDDLLRKVEM